MFFVVLAVVIGMTMHPQRLISNSPTTFKLLIKIK